MRYSRDENNANLDFRIYCLALVLALFFVGTSSAAKVPTIEDINSLSIEAKGAYDSFMQRSAEFRLKYEFSNQFINRADKEKLYRFAKEGSERLAQIEQEQKRLKQIIEAYDANDWDDRYGSTGLWRKLAVDIYSTALSKCEVDFILALSAAQKQEKIELLRTITDRLNSLEKINESVYLRFIRAKVFGLLAQDDLLYRPMAKQEFEQLLGRSELEEKIAIRLKIEQIRWVGEIGQNQLDAISEDLINMKSFEDIELVLSLAFLQRSFGKQQAFERIVRACPQTQGLVGSLLLSEIISKMKEGRLSNQILDDITVFEAELVARVISANDSKEHNEFLQELASVKKFQTPLILYMAAVKAARDEPRKAIDLFIASSRLQEREHSDNLDIEAEAIAKQAAQFAYEMYTKNLVDCNTALNAFDNYKNLSGKEIDGQLEYLYVYVFDNCNLPEEGKKVLQNLAYKSEGYWPYRAQLDLIEKEIEHKKSRGQKIPDTILLELKKIIEDYCHTDSEFLGLGREAVTVYSKLRFEQNDDSALQDVVNILTDGCIGNDPNLYALKSAALHKLGYIEQSAECLLKAFQRDPCRHTQQAIVLLSEVVETIDNLQAQKDKFLEVAENCRDLAQICYGCLEGSEAKRSGLLLAELSVFAATADKNELVKIEELLNNLNSDNDMLDTEMIRCWARLLTGQERFEEAAALWSKICGIQQAENLLSKSRNWKWWRAKYYELYCWSKMAKTREKDLLHTIEVLENTLQNIPELWAEKLELLKLLCSSNLSKE